MQAAYGKMNCSSPVQNKSYFRSAWSITAVTALLALMISPLSVRAGSARVVDHWDVYGAHGVLQVHGSLTESACRLATRSAWQDVPMGNISSGELQNIGDRGKPVRVELSLEDCMSSGSRNRDTITGSTSWSNLQPAVSVSFQASQDMDNPQLVKVSGAKGLALRITDSTGQDIRLGGHDTPLLLSPGQNQLTYTITAERTREPLSPGDWWSLINIGLSYY